MNTNDEKNTPNKSLATIGKVIILSLGILIVSLCVFPYFELFYVVIAICATLALFTAIVIPIIKKRLLPYSIPFLIAGLIFIVSSLIWMYGWHLTLPIHAFTKLIGVGIGLLMIGGGLIIVTLAVAMLDMNNSNLWTSTYKIGYTYPILTIISFFIFGIFLFVGGTYIFVDGLQVWNI